MRQKTVRAVVIGFLLFAATATCASEPETRRIVTAKSAILIDNQTGQVLWQRNADMPLPPASTTKIVTALLALQSGRLDDSLSVTTEAAQAPPSKIRLKAGWRMRLRDLVYAVLLNSANDASVVIAQGLAGSVQDFAARMNAKARALGATNTHFVNPNGLPADDHYSTARDLATMFARAMRDPLFETIVGTKTTVVSPTAGSARPILLKTHNRFLLGDYHVRVVGKTGFTKAAKKCFVGLAQADGRELVVAVLGSRDLWGDLKRLIEFGLTGTNQPAVDLTELELGSVPGVPAAAGDDEDDVKRPQATRAHYAVQLATFRHLGTATAFKDNLLRRGYKARVERVAERQTMGYRVSIDGYHSQREAQQAATSLKRAHRHLSPVVVASS